MFEFFKQPPVEKKQEDSVDSEKVEEIKKESLDLEAESMRAERAKEVEDEKVFGESMEKISQIEKDIDRLEGLLGVGDGEIMEIYESIDIEEARMNIISELEGLPDEEIEKLGMDIENIKIDPGVLSEVVKELGGKILNLFQGQKRIVVAASLLMIVGPAITGGVSSAEAGNKAEDALRDALSSSMSQMGQSKYAMPSESEMAQKGAEGGVGMSLENVNKMIAMSLNSSLDANIALSKYGSKLSPNVVNYIKTYGLGKSIGGVLINSQQGGVLPSEAINAMRTIDQEIEKDRKNMNF
ncbi:hypothetical protein ACFL08_00110 [Patescibacteria group bacterium]